jgi:hypothetical protein
VFHRRVDGWAVIVLKNLTVADYLACLSSEALRQTPPVHPQDGRDPVHLTTSTRGRQAAADLPRPMADESIPRLRMRSSGSSRRSGCSGSYQALDGMVVLHMSFTRSPSGPRHYHLLPKGGKAVEDFFFALGLTNVIGNPL